MVYNSNYFQSMMSLRIYH